MFQKGPQMGQGALWPQERSPSSQCAGCTDPTNPILPPTLMLSSPSGNFHCEKSQKHPPAFTEHLLWSRALIFLYTLEPPHCAHFTDAEIEAQQGKVMAQCHTACKTGSADHRAQGSVSSFSGVSAVSCLPAQDRLMEAREAAPPSNATEPL